MCKPVGGLINGINGLYPTPVVVAAIGGGPEVLGVIDV